jgi:hypothetical protein
LVLGGGVGIEALEEVVVDGCAFGLAVASGVVGLGSLER